MKHKPQKTWSRERKFQSRARERDGIALHLQAGETTRRGRVMLLTSRSASCPRVAPTCMPPSAWESSAYEHDTEKHKHTPNCNDTLLCCTIANQTQDLSKINYHICVSGQLNHLSKSIRMYVINEASIPWKWQKRLQRPLKEGMVGRVGMREGVVLFYFVQVMENSPARATHIVRDT